MTNKAAVIILNWNGKKLLQEFLPSVVEYTNKEIADVVVADNGSTDGSVVWLEQNFPEVKLVKFDKNYGYAEGYNKAIAAADYKYAILLNSDVKASPNWVEPMFEYMESHPEVAACQPKILSYKNPDEFEYAGASGGFIDSHGYPFCRGRMFGDVEKDNGQYDDIISIFWATGAGLFVRRNVYLAAGGLDKDFFAHMEEIDLCWRIHRMKYDIKVIPQSVIYHLGGGSLPASNPRKTYLNFRNNLLLLFKNLPAKEGKAALFVRRLYDTLAFFMFVMKFDFANANAVLKAHNDYRKMKKLYTPDATENLLNSFPETNRNIIFDYYLKGKKKF